MRREEIREKTMQLIYQMDMTGEFDYEKLSTVEETASVTRLEQARITLEAVRDHIEDIDRIISDNLDRWTFDRVAKTDLAILRTAAAEMMYSDSIPVSVSINEAVELSRKFSGDKSYAFVNSVLSKISRQLEG